MPGIVVLTTAPDAKTARSLAKRLVADRSAACVSIKDGFVSYYRWKGKLTKAGESLLLIKTEKSKFARVKQTLLAEHPYENPEIISLPVVQGSQKYLSWLSDSVK